MTAFAEPKDVEVLLGRNLDDDELARVGLILENRTVAMQDRLRQQVFPGTSSIEVRGTWNSELVLPEWPVVSVQAVAIEGVPLVSGWVATRRGIRRTGTSSIANLGGQGAVRYGNPHWGGPDCWIAVEYTHGYDEVPAVLEVLCRETALRDFGSKPNVAEEAMEDWRVKYTSSGSSGSFTSDELETLDRFPKPW